MNKKLIDDDHNNYLLSNTYNYKCRNTVLNAMLDNNKSRDQCNLSLVLKQYLYAKKQIKKMMKSKKKYENHFFKK